MQKEIENVNYYVLVGDENNWKKSLTKNFWGFTDKQKGLWELLSVGDFLAFYVTLPTKRIIGFGKVQKKFQSNEPFWPLELYTNNAIWKHRIKFDILFKVDKWDDGILVNKNIVLNSGRKKVSKNIFYNFVEEFKKRT